MPKQMRMDRTRDPRLVSILLDDLLDAPGGLSPRVSAMLYHLEHRRGD